MADLPQLWAAETTSDKDRKRLLRTLLADVTITPSETDPTQLAVGLRWKSGASCQLAVTRRRNAIQLRTTDPAAIALAQRIGPSLDNAALAAALNQAGHRTGTGQPFDGVAAANLRHYHHIPYPGLLTEGELTPRQVAERIGVSVGNDPLLDQRRCPARPPWTGQPLVHPLPARARSRLPRPRPRLRPPAPRYRPPTPPRHRAQRHRRRPPRRCQTRRHLPLGPVSSHARAFSTTSTSPARSARRS